MNTDCVNNSINTLIGFAPFWDVDRNCLFYTDVFNGTIYKFDWNNQKTNTGRIHGENQVSFIIPMKDDNNKFVVGCGKRLLLVHWDCNNQIIKTDRVLGELNKDGVRFNDAKCDNKGRLFIGTMRNEDFGDVYDNNKRDGGLFKFTMRDGLKQLKDQIGHVGGLVIDQNNKKLFCVDTNDLKLKQFDFDDNNGDIKNGNDLVDLNNYGQTRKNVPQGITLDQDGNIYVCMNGGGKILRINIKNRNVDQEIKVQTQNVTYLTFGGRNNDQLFINTAMVDLNGQQNQNQDRNQQINNGNLIQIDNIGTKGHNNNNNRFNKNN